MSKPRKYPIAHKQSELVVGKIYSVCHARLLFRRRTTTKRLIPILPLLHKDTQFGADFMHYHIDARFHISNFLKEWFRIENGITNTAIIHHIEEYKKIVTYEVLGLTYINKKCIGLQTGVNPPIRKKYSGGLSLWAVWYESMIGKSCAGRKCPHLGTTMMKQGDRLVCPMHNLIGSVKKEVIIRHPKIKKQLVLD